jgi:uncharacterized protein (TIGR00730 family)
MIQRIAVYCGSKKGRKVAYESAAKQLGAVLVDAKIELVFGGARVGLMGVVADAVINQGGRVTGVIPHGLDTKEVVHQNLTELVNVSGMHERKAKMLDLADAFIALPGGIGTMDEFFEAWTWYQLGIHTKPVGLLNVDGYFDSLIKYLHSMADQDFLSQVHINSLCISHCPATLVRDLTVSERTLETVWVTDEGRT